MREPRDIPELSDEDRPLPDSLRPFGAARMTSPEIQLQDAFYRGMRVGLEQGGRYAFLEVFVMLVCVFVAGVILGLLLPW